MEVSMHSGIYTLVIGLNLLGCVDPSQSATDSEAGQGGSTAGLEGGAANIGSRTSEGVGVQAGAGQGGNPAGLVGGAGGTEAGAGGMVASCELPDRFSWISSGPIIAPVSDASHDLVAIKDPTAVFYDERWHMYATSVGAGGIYGMVYLSFTDFDQVESGTFYHMDQTPGFNTYVAAPQLFHSAPRDKWYLVFQSGPPMYSTNDDPGSPEAWTRPARFFSSEPAIITENGGWLDFWVICAEPSCHLFFSDDHGRWYRSTTGIGDFPNGFSEPEIVMQDEDAGRLFEGCNVYQVQGTGQYLALIEAFDSTSNWRRYFRSWTADSLDGPWVPLRDSGGLPFAGPRNVSFEGEAWTDDISHGGLIRAGYDQMMQVDPCDLRFMYQGFDPSADTGDYNAIPWRLGLLTLAL
jgi:endo-1,4-beta-xylanase